MQQWDENCPACRSAKGRPLVTVEAHTCDICWACLANEDAGYDVVSLLGHICGKSNNPKKSPIPDIHSL